ncbi:MAG: AlwI family type II restriction endonuclease [Candidatus Methanofastidiosia archaeon]
MEGITKREVAIFLIPHRDPKGREKIIEKINDFRERLNRLHGRKPKNEFRDSYHLKSIEEIYKEEIENRRITIRERRQRGTIESFIQTKKRNSLDYADALIGHCRYSGLFSIKKKRLTLLPDMINEVEEILLMKHELVDFYDDVERFYSYMGNPNIPVLPYETEEKLIAKIQRLQFENVQLIEEVQKAYGIKIREKIPSCPKVYNLNGLKDCLDSLYQFKINLRKIKLELESQRPQFLDEIIECYERIVNREILSRDIYYEWNTWRAFVFLDDAIKKGK